MITHKEAIEIMKSLHKYTDVYCVADMNQEIKPVVELIESEMWHNYPDEKPIKNGYYIVKVNTINDDRNSQWAYWSGVNPRNPLNYGFGQYDKATIAWREFPKYESDVNEL